MKIGITTHAVFYVVDRTVGGNRSNVVLSYGLASASINVAVLLAVSGRRI